MKVIICGVGQVGTQLAKHLSTEGNDVVVIDTNPTLIKSITERMDVAGINGHAGHPEVLEKAGAKDADMIIAVTFSDEINMIVCQVAHSVFNIQRKISRIREEAYLEKNYADLYRHNHLPVDVIISPEQEVAQAAFRRIKAPEAFETEDFLNGFAQVVGISLDEDCPVINTPLKQLSELFSTLEAIVVAVRREGVLFVPEPMDQLFSKDQVYFFSSEKDINRTLEIFGKEHKKADNLIVIGGGNVGLNFAELIEKNLANINLKIIEKDRKRAEYVADKLQKTIVLNGDGLSQDILNEANIESANAFFSITNDDKTNLLSCTRAKAAGCAYTVALINDPSLINLQEPMGIDAFINPRSTTVSSILKYLRHGKVRAVYSIGNAEAEIIEAEIMKTSMLDNKTLRDIEWPDGSIVCGVLQDSKFVAPRGDTKFKVGDLVAVLTLSKDIQQIEKYFQVGIDYFDS